MGFAMMDKDKESKTGRIEWGSWAKEDACKALMAELMLTFETRQKKQYKGIGSKIYRWNNGKCSYLVKSTKWK